MAENGFGFWYGDTTNMSLPENFNTVQSLRIIGYEVSDSTAAIQAFRRHFLQTEKKGELNEAEKKVMYEVMQKFM